MEIDLLHKFYKGQCSEEEARLVVAWFASGDEKEKMFNQLQTLWENFEASEESQFSEINSEKVLKEIHGRIKKENQTEIEVNRFRYSKIHRFSPLKVAAIVLLAVFAGFIVQRFVSKPYVQSYRITSVEIPAGEKRTIQLEDGTKVILNSGSKFSYPVHFAVDKREVILRGEAFFEVKKDVKPFIVKTPHLTATVLGTSFNMKANAEGEESSVALLTGKVVVGLLEEGQQSMVLHPGEKGALDREQDLLVKKSFDAEQETAWKDGILLFREMPFSVALHKMEKWYGVKFVVDEMPSQDFLVTGKFRQESLDNVLQSIGYTGKFTHQIKGNKVYLTFN